MTQLFVNNYATKTTQTFGAADTFLNVESVEGLPAISGGDYVLLTLYRLTGAHEHGHEVVKVTAINANMLTVVRSVEGAAATVFNTETAVEARVTAGSLSIKADALVSGVNIKTVNNLSILGSGNLALASTSLAGNKTIYSTQTIEYTITNYNVFSDYSVHVNAGSVVIVGNVISFTAPSLAQNVTLTVTMDGVPTLVVLTVLPAGINTPIISEPLEGATNVLPDSLVSTEGFSAFGLPDTHLNTDWEIWSGVGGTGVLLASLEQSTSNKTSWVLPNIALNTKHYLRVRYCGDLFGYSGWAEVGFTTISDSVVTPTITWPIPGATGVSETPIFTSSNFTTIGLPDTHLNTDWELWSGAGRTGTLIWSSLSNTGNKTSVTIPSGLVAVNTEYHLSVRYRGVSLGASEWVTASFTTASSFNNYIATPTPTPLNYGDPFEGGFYMGLFWNQISQSTSSKTLATGTQVFTVPDMTAVPLVYAGQQLEVRSRANPANKFIGTVIGAIGTSLTLNVSSIGGSGTFSDWSVMSKFRHIEAPKASGEHAGIALKNANTALPAACQTLTEGWEATLAMVAAGDATTYPAAHWARNLVIGGKNDWHIPARDVLELSWRNGKPTTDANYITANRETAQTFDYKRDGSVGDTANTHGTNNNSFPVGAAYTSSVPAQTTATAFKAGGVEAFEYGSAYYWSSSDYNVTSAWRQYWDSSLPGRQNSVGKASAYRVRASRRSII